MTGDAARPDDTPPGLQHLPDELIVEAAPAPSDEFVPLFGTWGRWYGVVLGTLGALILLFYWFTKVYE